MSNLKSYIDNQLSDITINDDLSNKILNATTRKGSQKRYQYTVRRCVAFASIICILVTGSVTALAAKVPIINNMIYSMNPTLAEMLYPINKSTENNGIKVEVLNAVNDNHNTAVYFTVQDLSRKNRVNETIDLCDSCDINGPTAFNVEFLSYDKESNKALFVMRGAGGEGMSNQMTDFKINMIMSNKVEHDWYNTDINITKSIDQNAKSIPLSEVYYTGGSNTSEKVTSVLEPDVMSVSLGNDVDFVTISNIGIIDGKLHVQTKWDESFDNHGELWLVDKNGVVNGKANAIKYSTYYFKTSSDTSNGEKMSKHIEYVFDVGSLDELSGYSLWASLVGDGDITKGNWKVNFRLKDSKKITVNNPNGIADRVEVTSLGAYINGYRGSKCETTIKMKDGTTLSYSDYNTKISSETNKSQSTDMSFAFASPIKIEDVSNILIDGKVIY